MKKLFLSLCFLSLSMVLYAQKTLPEIKDGTILQASVFVQGQAYPLTFTVKTTKAPISIGWSVDGYGDGEFVMNEKALESGNSYFLNQPALGTTKLGDSETYGLISKKAFKALTDTKEFTYSNIKFKVKAEDKPMKIGDKEVDVIKVGSADGKIELWILNNANLPLLVQTAGMPFDIVVDQIK